MKKFESYEQQINVGFAYPVIFDRQLFAVENDTLAHALCRLEKQRHKLLVFVDEGVARAHPGLCGDIVAYARAHTESMDLVAAPRVVPGGEAIKNDYRLIMEVLDTILEYQLCRHSFVVAVGGGAVLDAVGFAASMVHRGLRLIRVPTTVLAQDDAGVGVKNGMNLHGMKNAIGTFHPPFAVLNDFSFLATLSQDDWLAGIAEAFKVAIIKDRGFLDDLCARAALLARRDQAAIEEVVARCARLHLEHIRTNNDPFEMGTARPLDFGHWAAHKLEQMSGYTITHGLAVAVGIMIDSYYAMRKGWIQPGEFEQIKKAFTECGFRLWHEVLARRMGDGRLELLQGIQMFREHLGGRLCVTFPDGLGALREEHALEEALIEEAVEYLRARCGARVYPAERTNTSC
ncbi:MAG: 3-dehydroquinate synthase [Spartobacteria bacterium]|nr:3-dehydroquinate synthase [Spartobacteria bacterium]